MAPAIFLLGHTHHITVTENSKVVGASHRALRNFKGKDNAETQSALRDRREGKGQEMRIGRSKLRDA
jgi:hypothetical protein